MQLVEPQQVGLFSEPDELKLRPYQVNAIERLREAFRSGKSRLVLSSPTGSGKTVVATWLMRQVARQGKRCLFIVDRLALVRQTAEVLSSYGLEHGIIQGANTYAEHRPIVVASAQTLENREEELDNIGLIVIDECHIIRKKTILLLDRMRVPVIGLSATPFARSLGQVFDGVINSTTTFQLQRENFLVPLRVFAAMPDSQIDMAGAATTAGEWRAKDIERQSMQVNGDIVQTWIDKTKTVFGGPVKTIVFSASIAHGEELCKEWEQRGYDFRQVSAYTKEEERLRIISDFRQGTCIGVISCEALGRGFDVPDILVGVSARPYRKSFSAHLQQLGRVMRISPGKKEAMWLCHTGNYLAFNERMQDFYRAGASSLNDSQFRDRVRKTPSEEEIKAKTCEACHIVLPLNFSVYTRPCPACGHQAESDRWSVTNLPATVRELQSIDGLLDGKESHFWDHICRIATRRKGDTEAAKRFALGVYRSIFNVWPTRRFKPSSEPCDPQVERLVRDCIRRYVGRAKMAERYSRRNDERRSTIRAT